jgi:hypothetical protein
MLAAAAISSSICAVTVLEEAISCCLGSISIIKQPARLPPLQGTKTLP